MNSVYTHTELSDHIIRIDAADVSAYLAIGSDRAALIDSCEGEGNIAEYAHTLTDRPLFCILTHGHMDHIGGAMTVSERYLNPLDFFLARDKASAFLPLADGQRFDLGGLHLTALSFPGHTPGSMAILFEEERTLLLGDACNPLTFLFFPYSSSVEEYRRTIIAFRQMHGSRFDKVLFSHFEQAGPEILEENQRVCDRILSHKADDIPFTIPRFATEPEKPAIAMAILGHPKERRRADGKVGNIVYIKSSV